MKTKKSDKANIEKDRIIFFEIGLLITLAIILATLEWSKVPLTGNDEILTASAGQDIEEFLIRTKRDDPEKKKEKPRILEILPVPDNTEGLEDFDLPDFRIKDNEAVNWAPLEAEPDEPAEIVDFIIVEDKPLFMGENPDISFRRFIMKKLRYPEDAINNNIEGRVTVMFIIDEKGNVTDIEVVGGVHPVIDNEAVRVIKSSPLWTPGKQRDKPVKVRYYFPVNFKLK